MIWCLFSRERTTQKTTRERDDAPKAPEPSRPFLSLFVRAKAAMEVLFLRLLLLCVVCGEKLLILNMKGKCLIGH